MRTVRISWPEGQKYPRLIEETAGFAIEGVKSLTIHAAIDEIVSVDAEIWASDVKIGDIKADAKFWMKHPVDGDVREVASITFADGSTVEF